MKHSVENNGDLGWESYSPICFLNDPGLDSLASVLNRASLSKPYLPTPREHHRRGGGNNATVWMEGRIP